MSPWHVYLCIQNKCCVNWLTWNTYLGNRIASKICNPKWSTTVDITHGATYQSRNLACTSQSQYQQTCTPVPRVGSGTDNKLCRYSIPDRLIVAILMIINFFNIQYWMFHCFPYIISSGVPRNFVRVGGFSKFNCGQRAEWTGIWGR